MSFARSDLDPGPDPHTAPPARLEPCRLLTPRNSEWLDPSSQGRFAGPGLFGPRREPRRADREALTALGMRRQARLQSGREAVLRIRPLATISHRPSGAPGQPILLRSGSQDRQARRARRETPVLLPTTRTSHARLPSPSTMFHQRSSRIDGRLTEPEELAPFRHDCLQDTTG